MFFQIGVRWYIHRSTGKIDRRTGPLDMRSSVPCLVQNYSYTPSWPREGVGELSDETWMKNDIWKMMSPISRVITPVTHL